MYNLKVYHGTELYMTHSQGEFDAVLQIALNSLVAIRKQDGTDYRVEMTNRAGDIFFLALALGPNTKHPINVDKKGGHK